MPGMARLDRPIGWWLLLLPCWWSAALAADALGQRYPDPWHLVLFLVGAIAMRGAGCTYNDIVDRDIDAKVARTRARPIPSGQVSVREREDLPRRPGAGRPASCSSSSTASPSSSASPRSLTVAIYPFLKRVTDWPQLGLGIAFSWGALMGWAAAFGSLVAGAGPPLSRRHRLDDRLRHDLRPPGQGRRRAGRRPLHGPAVRRARRNRISPASTSLATASLRRVVPRRGRRPDRLRRPRPRRGAARLAGGDAPRRRPGQLPPPLPIEPRLRPDPVRRARRGCLADRSVKPTVSARQKPEGRRAHRAGRAS